MIICNINLLHVGVTISLSFLVAPVEALPIFPRTQPRTFLCSSVSVPTVTGLAKTQPVNTIPYTGDPSDPNCNVEDEYDAIVIGSGLGGLTASSLLAQSPDRLKVLLLEQHSVCGGCCHTFRRGPYVFPTGLHYVGEMNSGDNLRKILDPLTYDAENDPLEWDPLYKNFDTIIIGEGGKDMKQYHIAGGSLDEQKADLKKQFPSKQDHEAIDEYYTHVQKAIAAFRRANVIKCLPLPLTKFLRLTGLHRLLAPCYQKYASETLSDIVSSVTDNEELKTVLQRDWDCYGCEPSRASFLMQAQITQHFSTGPSFPQGGPGMIAKKIIPTITSSGGAVLAKAPVRRIILDKNSGRAIGVKMMDGRVIKAKRAVISDAGVMNTLQHLLPRKFKQRQKLFRKFFPKREVRHSSNALHEGSSALNLFVGVKGDHDADFHLPLRSNVWAFPSSSVDNHLKLLESLTLKEAVKSLEPKDIGLVFITSSSCKDSTWRDEHPGRTVLEIMTSIPQKWFDQYAPDPPPSNAGAFDPGGKPGSHGREYKELKMELGRLIWSRVVEVLTHMGATNLPELDDVDYSEVGTPLTFAHFLFRDHGGFYGLDHDIDRFSPRNYYEVLRPEITEVPGLFLTGQDVTSCGIGGALSGGVLAAGKVLRVANPFSIFDDMAASKGKEM